MNKTVFALLGAALMASSIISTAEAWERRGGGTGPAGGSWSSSGSGDGYGNRSYQRSYTGPGGNTWTNSGRVTRNSDGSVTREGARTNPYGGGVTYGGTGSCQGDTCTYSGSRSRY
jgi:hypothetical protein